MSSFVNSIWQRQHQGTAQTWQPVANGGNPALTVSATLSSSSAAIEHAFSYPSAIRMGWIPRSRRVRAEDSSAPARTWLSQRMDFVQSLDTSTQRCSADKSAAGGCIHRLTNNTSRPVPNLVVLRL